MSETPVTKRHHMKQRPPRRAKEAIALTPLMDAIQDALDYLRMVYEDGFNVEAAGVHLQAVVDDVAEAIERNRLLSGETYV